MERKRMAAWWIRWGDLNWPSVDGFDRIKERAEKMARANITTAMISGTHFRWDYLPYFTILHDYLATVAEELRKYGIELYDHHSVSLIHRYDTREEMRHVMLHSGPHLPFSPSREAAATWTYKGKYLNDWRMIDVKTRDVLYLPQYAAEGFCHRNPEFRESYFDYVKTLIADTGISGLSADDPTYFMQYSACACPHCRAELKRRTGIELPSIEDRNFWGNWANPAWKQWIDLRYDASGEFMEELAQILPKNFALTTCGGCSSTPTAPATGTDAESFMRGGNIVNLEMCGNTPPYKKDPVTVNEDIAFHMISASHHQAVAREKNIRCLGIGFAFFEATANIVWAVNKVLDSDCWLITLKDRLGLPEHILKTLPNEADIIGNAYRFEKEHMQLFEGKQIAQLAVYFSYETRDHNFFGNFINGYYKDYAFTIETLFHEGISAHTICSFPTDTKEYSLILVPSAASLTEKELTRLYAYLAAGGKVIITGPSPLKECENKWKLPSRPDIQDPTAFFSTIRDGVWPEPAKWTKESMIAPSGEPDVWRQPAEGLYYHPHRISDKTITDSLLELCWKNMNPLPMHVLEAEGYLITMFRNKNAITVHLLAADYDTDIDHHLDEIRFHRSRVNLINKVSPAGVTKRIRIKCDLPPQVYTPLEKVSANIEHSNGISTITLSEKASYILLHFANAGEGFGWND